MPFPELAVVRPTWLTGGLVRLLVLAAFVVAVGMVRTNLTRERATVLVVVGAAAVVARA